MAPATELIDDATAEILLRIPPDQPAHLVRAAAVCKPWRRVVSDPAFLRRYRAFHRGRALPLLGFFYNRCNRDAGNVPRFIPTVAASPLPRRALHDYDDWWVLDCRHSGVLFGRFTPTANLVVWDPVTGDGRLVDLAVHPAYYTAAVLCAARGCGHLDCRGGPFRVVLAGHESPGNVVRVRVYSSEAAAWIASADVGVSSNVARKPSALIGHDLYFLLMSYYTILRYDIDKNCLSTIQLPTGHVDEGGIVLTPMEDGSLGFTGVRGSRLCVWSRNVNPQGIAGWVRCRVIELMTLIPFMPYSEAHVVGSAEGLGIIFVETDVGLFMIVLKSGRERKVGEPGNYFSIFPFMSFYTPDFACGKLLLPGETH